MQRVVIVGADSYLANGLEKHFLNWEVNNLFFYNWEKNKDILRRADCIINFSISPDFSEKIVPATSSIDYKISQTIKDTNAHFIFISSRKVYGSSNTCKCFTESTPLKQSDFYSINKIALERELQNIKNLNLSILRVANIIGEPVLRKNYKTFIGWICENFLANKKLKVSQNSQAKKDFITKEFLHKSIYSIAQNKICEVLNISSGFATSINEVLSGYVGAKNLELNGENLPCADQFILDNTRLKKLTGLSISKEDIQLMLSEFRKILTHIKNAQQ